MEMPKRKDFQNHLGERFCRLVIVSYSGNDGNCNSLWECMCDCGKTITTRWSSLRRGTTKSCGCLQREAVTRHGYIGTPEYRSWNSMKERCLNPKAPGYERYGGRGITVCERWKKFENFILDMGNRPSKKHSIDRWPNRNGNYEKSNCRWATQKEQNRNKDNNRLVLFQGKKMPVSEAAEKAGINKNTVYDRLSYGWSDKDALTIPVKKIRKKR